MNHGKDNEVIEAVELWSSICDEETSREESEQNNLQIIETVSKELVQVLFGAMTRASSIDDDTLTPSSASATCLSLISTLIESKIIPIIIPLIETNIDHKDFHFRDASILALGMNTPPISIQYRKRSHWNETA